VLRVLALVGTTLLLAGCGREDTLDPASPQQHRIVNLFWGMTIGAVIGFAIVLFLLWLGWHRRNRTVLPGGIGERGGTALVVTLGIAVPIVVLSALFVWSDVFVMRATSAPGPGTTRLTIEVIGHQWWWEARYPGTDAVTANEIHIPAGERVGLRVSTADVIHTIWIARLNRKIDMIPGRTNEIVLQADEPGRYRGQCYEFCGLQHAHMGLWIVADPPDRFRAWLADEARPAAVTGGQGERVFLDDCSACHQIRGTPADAMVGPDLTHLATRETIAAATLPRSDLEAWIRDPQHFKPGVRMPAVPLSDAELRALVDYLERLK
jgi:cytochrome c oxidase subunit 2